MRLRQSGYRVLCHWNIADKFSQTRSSNRHLFVVGQLYHTQASFYSFESKGALIIQFFILNQLVNDGVYPVLGAFGGLGRLPASRVDSIGNLS
jgi:hypothetical protein